ncbi:MAG: peptidylprolyl isomerase [Saprospiraceae bacterium]
MIKKTLVFWMLILFSGCSNPRAMFEIEAKKLVAPTNIPLKNTSKGADKFLWDFGNGSYSTDQNPSIIYRFSGNYKLQLTAFRKDKSSTISKEIQVLAPDNCLVHIETNKGSMLVNLLNETPKHQDNFIKLVENDFYENTMFHRVISGFMIQGGDPDSKGASQSIRLGNGGPGYTISNEIHTNHFHIKGALAAARMSDDINPNKESSGSQFYLVQGRILDSENLEIFEAQKNIYYNEKYKNIYQTLGGAPQLDMEYTVFGQLIEGFEVLDLISSTPTDLNDRPKEDIIILKTFVIK